MAPSSDKARGQLDTAVDWLYVAWVRAAAWNDAQTKSFNGPAGIVKAFLFSGVVLGAMLVVFGTGKRLWTKKLGSYGTVQLQNRFSWDRGAAVKDGYAIYPYEFRHTSLFMGKNPQLYEGMAIGAWDAPRREEVWSELKSWAATRVGSLSWRQEGACMVGSGEGTRNMVLEFAPVSAVVCEDPDRRLAAIWYGPREYGSIADQVRLVTAAISSYRPDS